MSIYLESFNLSSAPFSSTPDTRFYVETNLNESLFSQMIGAINQDDGFVRITGEAGAGKTILCRKLLNALRCHATRYKVIHIPNPRLSEEGLYMAIAQELNLETSSTRKSLLESIVTNLSKQQTQEKRNTVLIVDEGQSMPDDTLEALTELLDHCVEGRKLLRVALFSMPPDETQRELPAFKLLQDRITLEKELQPLNAAGVARYIEARLNKVGAMSQVLYSDEAIALICKASKGVPRLINLLAHKSLLNTYNAGLQQVQALQVRLAIAATEFSAADETEFKANWLSRLRKRST
jgi:MSHA biogenesis protein MshM